MNIFYVYHLIDPRDNTPFYVGKGKGKRMYKHEKLAKRNIASNNNKHLFYKLKELLNKNLTITYYKVYENLSEVDAWNKETTEEIRLRSLGVKLCNIAKCGKGGDNWTNSSNKEEIIKKIRNAVMGKKNGMFGKTLSDEAKRKIREALKNRIISEETRKKISKIHLGKVLSDDTKRKISEAKTGIKFSDEVRQKMSKSHTGILFSENHRKNISSALRGRTFSDEHKQKLSSVAKMRTGSSNSNYRPLSIKSKKFISENLNAPVNWIVRNLQEKVSYGRVARYIKQKS
jgi:hypothetical protein